MAPRSPSDLAGRRPGGGAARPGSPPVRRAPWRRRVSPRPMSLQRQPVQHADQQHAADDARRRASPRRAAPARARGRPVRTRSSCRGTAPRPRCSGVGPSVAAPARRTGAAASTSPSRTQASAIAFRASAGRLLSRPTATARRLPRGCAGPPARCRRRASVRRPWRSNSAARRAHRPGGGAARRGPSALTRGRPAWSFIHARDETVEPLAIAQEHRLVRDVAQQGVLERVLHGVVERRLARGGRRARARGPLERPDGRVEVVAPERSDGAVPEHPPDDRRALQGLALGRREAVEAGLQHAGQGGRHPLRVAAARRGRPESHGSPVSMTPSSISILTSSST